MTSKEALETLFDLVCEKEHTNSEHNFCLKLYKTIEKDLIKLNCLEDIEEEIGIDLITLFKALKQEKVWTKYKNKIDCCDCCQYMFLVNYIDCYWDNGKRLVFALKDYGKTWALTKEELEDDKVW